MQHSRTVRLACVYCAYVFVVLFGIGFVGFAGFLPPPSPAVSADEITRFLFDDVVAVRVGLCIQLFASALLLPWGAAVASQIKQVEGRFSPLAYAWIAATGCIVMEFLFPAMFWAAAVFRPEDSPELIRKFNDLAWLPWLGIISTGVVQALALAIVAFTDTSTRPAYPRWFGYFQVFVAITLSPADLDLFLKTGPIAWDGVVTFWLPVTAAFAWIVVTTAMTARAVKAAPDPDDEHADLAARIAALESALEKRTGTVAPRGQEPVDV